MAHTKAKGTSKLGRDSVSKRLGVKIFGGQSVACGQIIVRQRGSKYYSGENTKMGADDTIFALKDGKVVINKKLIKNFSGKKAEKTIVSVI